MVKIIGYIDNDGTFHEEERTTPVTTNSTKKIPTTAPAMTQVAKPKTVEPTVTLKDAISNYNDVLNNGYVKNKGLSWDNLITDLANQSDARKQVYESIPVIGGLFKAKNTAKKTATNMGEGALKTGESVLDTLNDWADAINNPLTYAGNKAIYGKETADKALKESKQATKDFIKRDLVNELNENTGWNNYLPEWEKDSLVKRENIGGKVAQGIGGMVPALLAGQYLGFAPETTSLKGLTGAAKTKAIAGNIAKTYLGQLPANAVLGAQSYGGGMEEALNKGASLEDARKYGLANAAIEQATEMMTGGVPGLQGKGGLDQFVEPLIDKTGKGYVNALLRAGYGALGEGLEESAADYLDALAQKNILGEKINWKDVNKQALESGLVGAITGAILNTPSNIQGFQEARANNQIEKQNAVKYKDKLKNVDLQEPNEFVSVDPLIPKFFDDAKLIGEHIIDEKNIKNNYINNKINDISNNKKAPIVEQQNIQETVQETPQQENVQPQTTENNIKNEQLNIIKESNPMTDDYHVGIRDINDIKTFDEAINDDESFTWGDYSKEDAQRDLEKGTVTVYSSKPIEQGEFVSTSKNQARDYAGGGEIYSQAVPINDVAWINGDEGQYAKVEGTSDSSFR